MFVERVNRWCSARSKEQGQGGRVFGRDLNPLTFESQVTEESGVFKLWCERVVVGTCELIVVSLRNIQREFFKLI